MLYRLVHHVRRAQADVVLIDVVKLVGFLRALLRRLELAVLALQRVFLEWAVLVRRMALRRLGGSVILPLVYGSEGVELVLEILFVLAR